jgi:predicted DNA-binding helix-hairpin-helix protein
MARSRGKLLKRKKWRSLTIAAGHDKVEVPIFEAAGRGCKIPLLKTLMSSYCQNDCKFCAFRAERRAHRDRWEPTQLANVAFKVWRRRQIRGVFLSSSVDRGPNKMVEEQIETARLLRERGFTDYIHLRLMPGTDYDLIKQSVQLADRVGINVEFPSASHYNDMKIFLNFKQDIVKRVRLLAREIKKAQTEEKCRAGLDSQMVVGASNETDKEILKVADWMYNKLDARRVYFSSFKPVASTPLEDKPAENRWREYRLYQSSFLIQKYGFKRKDFVLDNNDMLILKYDPKYIYATKNEVSININSADFNELIKIPGIGIETANRILESRALGARFKNMKELKNVGVIVKRAAPFVEIGSRQTRLSHFG